MEVKEKSEKRLKEQTNLKRKLTKKI